MWNIVWKIFLEIGIMEMVWKCLGRIWGVPSLFRKFLGNFRCKENEFSLLLVHCSGVLSIFSSAKRMTRGPGLAGLSCWHCAMHGVYTVPWTRFSFSLVDVDWVHRRREEGSRVTTAWGPRVDVTSHWHMGHLYSHSSDERGRHYVLGPRTRGRVRDGGGMN